MSRKEWPKIGDEVNGALVQAIGIKDGERWVMTIDKRLVVSLWPEGTWGYWKNNGPAKPKEQR